MANNTIGHGILFTLPVHDQFIDFHGVDMLHEIAIACTCRVEDVYAGLIKDGEQRRREPHCEKCGGSGWLYRDPIVARGMITNIRQQKNILDVGVTQPGDSVFSPQIGVFDCNGTSHGRRVGTWDRLTASWGQPLDDGQVVVRGAATLNENVILKTGLDPNEDRLWYEPISAIWCEDEDGVVYNQDADFVLGPGKIIKWIGNKPATRKRYTLKYNALFEWIVFQPPQERRDHDNDIGLLVFLRKRHIAIVNESPFISDTDRLEFRARMKC